MDLTQRGIAAVQSGDTQAGRSLLDQAIQARPDDELAWQWLARIVETAVERRVCLERLVALNPQNTIARAELARMGPSPTHTPTPAELIAVVRSRTTPRERRTVGWGDWLYHLITPYNT